MAVVDDDLDQRATTGGDAAKETPVPVSIDDADLAGVDIVYDASDFWERGECLPMGIYGVKIFAGREGWQKWSSGHYSIECDHRIETCETNPDITNEVKGQVIMGSYGTMIPRGKRTSSIASLLARYGVAPEKLTDSLTTSKVFQKLLAKEPLIYVLLDWKGWSKKGKEVLHWGMEEFPPNPEAKGTYLSSYRTAKGETINAFNYVRRVYGPLANAQDAINEMRKGAQPKVTAISLDPIAAAAASTKQKKGASTAAAVTPAVTVATPAAKPNLNDMFGDLG